MFLLPLNIFGKTAKAANQSSGNYKIREIIPRKIPHKLRCTFSLSQTDNVLSVIAEPTYGSLIAGQSIGRYDNVLTQKHILKFPRIIS